MCWKLKFPSHGKISVKAGEVMKIKVFIADSSKEMPNNIIEIIGADENISVLGYVHDGLSLLEKLKSAEIDVLLMNMMLPHYDGMDILHMLIEDNNYIRPKHTQLTMRNFHTGLGVGSGLFFDASDEY